jgi:hypothetical protein
MDKVGFIEIYVWGFVIGYLLILLVVMLRRK